MMSGDPNGTMTTFINLTESPNKECIDRGSHEWLYSYQPQYMLVIFVLGFIENVFVISVFVFHKSRCTVTEIYLGNMAAADLIFVISLPFRAVYGSNKSSSWPFGGFMCKAVFSSFQLNFYSSIYFLLMVSIERYLGVVKVLTIGLLRNPWWAKVTCGIIWVFAVGLSAPNGLFRKLSINERLNTTICVNDKSLKNFLIAVNITRNVLGFLVPLVVTTFCTSQVIWALRNNAMRHLKKENKEIKATWLVLSVFLVFMVCWIPYNTTIFIFTLVQCNVVLPCMVTAVNRIVHQISFYLVLSNSCINPILYCMVGNNFRQKAREVYSRLPCKGLDRRGLSVPTSEPINLT
ncbi:B2 bradykinin receptor-like [Dendropsophus ebraccatus]|uniref:B2 bradykinin receptor-like n=1 Tax=Dendropsophus ebraccatus TaxID=150705 RepID=UPI003831539F